jgi:hypothetical protein
VTGYTYVGEELDLYVGAVNWKAYVQRRLAQYIRGDVLEVGAGIGGTTRVPCDGRQESWTCLEPDPALAERLVQSLRACPIAPAPDVRVGFIDDLESGRQFDSILYIDVLEHIAEDRAELERAARRLRWRGCIVVLSPAHPFLYTAFDESTGHLRRYNARGMRGMRPDGLELERTFYMDSVGMLLSLGNRLILKQKMPTPAQLRLWDRVFVRCSRVVDPLTCGRLGKSIVGVWRGARPSA